VNTLRRHRKGKNFRSIRQLFGRVLAATDRIEPYASRIGQSLFEVSHTTGLNVFHLDVQHAEMAPFLSGRAQIEARIQIECDPHTGVGGGRIVPHHSKNGTGIFALVSRRIRD
jgi:hypothetical protein